MHADQKTDLQILVVDDDPSVRKVISMLLRYDGHDVESVDSGDAALALLTQRAFHIVVTDYTMPEMTGDQLIVCIRNLHPGLPVIMITAFPDHQVLNQSQGRADALLLKPFTREALRAAINQVLTPPSPDQSGNLPWLVNPPPPQKFIPPPETQAE
jgi:CheY-like chemotaxis protein